MSLVFYSGDSNDFLMAEKVKSDPKPVSSALKITPPIIAKPGGEQPGTKAHLQKAEVKEK